MTEENGSTLAEKLKRALIGKPRNIKDPTLFHKLALIPILAWIGLGADGLSSSSYGPEEAFKTLGQHTYLALFLALATATTVLIISVAYSRIIEYFPSGGGGYIVATHTLGEKAGVVSGAALLVDYMLTITVSIVSCGAAIFSFLPASAQQFKIPFDIFAILLLVVLNLRGVKESVSMLAPIFIVFVITHVLMIGYGIFSHVGQIGPVAQQIHGDFKMGLATLGAGGIILLFLKAFSIGGGTYFASPSSRFTIQNGVILMGGAAVLLLLYSKGGITTLVVMYSINVFLTFSLSQLGMSRFFIKNRAKEPKWKKYLPIHLIGLVVCVTVLVITSIEKFALGGWLTFLITFIVIVVCYLTRSHYNKVCGGVRELDDLLLHIPVKGPVNTAPVDPKVQNAIQLVKTASHLVESIAKKFPKSTVFAGQSVFQQPSLIYRLMHNETAFAIQQELRWKGITTIILPIRINI